VARWRAYGPPARCQITQESLSRAVSWGYAVSDIRLLLRQALGGAWTPALDAWCAALSRVHCEDGYRLRAASPHVMDALRQRKPFARRTRALASRQDAWVGRDEAQALFSYLRRAGYAVQAPAGPSLPLLSPALRKALPLPQLLVALRTYAHLRASVPGLGAPGLEPLEREIAAALQPEQLAGVQQIVESNVILLTWAKGPERRDEGSGMEDDGRSESREVPAPAPSMPEPDVPERLQDALETGGTVEIFYVDARAQLTQRTVRPLRLERHRGRSVLVAYCALRREERHFRLDRILRVQEPGPAEPDALPFPE
jgi:hypothetical protein